MNQRSKEPFLLFPTSNYIPIPAFGTEYFLTCVDLLTIRRASESKDRKEAEQRREQRNADREPSDTLPRQRPSRIESNRNSMPFKRPRANVPALLLLSLLGLVLSLNVASAVDLTNSLVVDIIRSDAGVTTLLREYIVLNSSISPLSGSPTPPLQGARGQLVVYDACAPSGLKPTVFQDLKYLALVQNLSSPCALNEKIANLAADPLVSAAVFYDPLFPNATKDLWVPQLYANSNVPFYWMDDGLGSDYADLLRRVYATYPPGSYIAGSTVVVVGTLFGREYVLPSGSGYKQSLFIAGVVVVGVMLTAFAYFMWRSRQRVRNGKFLSVVFG